MKAIVFDVDHTLIDFDEDEKSAFVKTCRYFGVSPTQEDVQAFWELSYESWTKHGLHLVQTERIQRDFHALYAKHVSFLFEEYEKRIPLPKGREEVFTRFISGEGRAIEDSLSIVKELSKRYDVYIATNGLSVIQRGRTKEYLPYVREIFISEEVGAIKPDRQFFDQMLHTIPYPPDEILMVGDSYASDMVGAKGAGIKTCHFNRRGEEHDDVDYTIRSLKELFRIL